MQYIYTYIYIYIYIYTYTYIYAATKSLQSCPTLCDPIDGSPPGSPIPGILQARTLEWVAISFSKAWKWKVKLKSLSHVRLLATLWTAAYQAPPSMGFSRQKYWSGVPLPSPYIYIKPRILMQATWAQNPLKDDWLSAHRRVSCMYNHKEILISPFLLISHWKQKVPFKNMSYIL